MNGVAFRTAVCTLLAGLVLAVPAHAKPRETVVVTGEARAIDGDTIEVDGTRIRLQGIDAPETRQSCTTADGVSWACGRYATAVLAAAVASVEVTCTARGSDRYQRVVAVCWAGMVEEAARAAALGIWAGEFEAPWDWRRARRRG